MPGIEDELRQQGKQWQQPTQSAQSMHLPQNQLEQKNTILIITTRQLCYSSAIFFAARLGEEFEKLGFSVEMCELDSLTNTNRGDETVLSQKSEYKLEQYIGKHFYAVIDINSRLPRMILDDGSYYLDQIDAPFYDYILDHPLYHHRSLSCHLKNYHVIMVDREHCSYVRAYYPHIRSVIWQTLGASTAIMQRSWDDKKEEILFPGTYRDPEDYLELIQESRLRDILLAMTDRMLSEPDVTIVEALQSVLQQKGLAGAERCLEQGSSRNIESDISGLDVKEESFRKQFAALLNEAYPVELYVRNYHRKAMIDALISAHVPLAIAGEWWEHYVPKTHPDLQKMDFRLNGEVVHERAVTFAQSFERIARSAVLVDSSPFFHYGIHDRVYAGMANHTAVLTDWNPCKQEILGIGSVNNVGSSAISRAGSSVDCNADRSAAHSAGVTYHLTDPVDLVDRAEELLINREFRRTIVDNGYALFTKEHTWGRVAEKLVAAMQADHEQDIDKTKK